MSNTAIKSITARQLIDCKCRPMLEVDVVTEGGALGRGKAPPPAARWVRMNPLFCGTTILRNTTG